MSRGTTCMVYYVAVLVGLFALIPCSETFLSFPIGVGRPQTLTVRTPFRRGEGVHAQSSSTTMERTMTGSIEGGQDSEDRENKQREFELNRGAAVDTLLSDYSSMFDSNPMDFDIYHEKIRLEDSQGFTLEGKPSYKLFFKTVTNLLKIAFSDTQTSVVLMDKYGIDKSKIKLRWRIELRSRLNPRSWSQLFNWMDKDGDGVLSQGEINDFRTTVPSWRKADTSSGPLVLEGISEYKLDSKGLIYEHKITVTYPASPFSLAPLRELLPVRRAPGLAGVAGMTVIPQPVFVPTQDHALAESLSMGSVSLFSSGGGAAVVAWPAHLEARMTRKNDGGQGGLGGLFASVLPTELRKKMPKTCESDYDCNPGGYNFPLICADFVVARFCIDPDDWKGGGLGAHAWDLDNMDKMLKEPIPVRRGDGYPGNGI